MCRLETDTHKLKNANRVKTENLIQKDVLGWMSAQGQTAQKTNRKRTEVKDLLIPKQNRKREALSKL